MPAKSMDKIMALAKRRGFIYQASEIYGGLSGFWDYGPLGAQLKKNLRDAWWEDVVLNPSGGRPGPNGEPVRVVPLDTSIIQHPKVWEASGHVAGFSDPMVDCRETQQRYRFDHVLVYAPASGDARGRPLLAFVPDTSSESRRRKQAEKAFGEVRTLPLAQLPRDEWSRVVAPDAERPGTLTEPRAFNLMFKTYVGATASEDDVAYLRPETAQGIFVQFKNVVDTTRVKLPFGIAQVGKAFRNEVTPRNFTFRSREFEQMEIEFFCHPSEARDWYAFWRDERMRWWRELGLAGENLQLRVHEPDELAHYAREGAGTADVEYRFPFTAPGFGELEGIAHRSSFDLAQHQQHSRSSLEYFDAERGELLPNGAHKGEKYLPHVIEPSAGLDRGVLAVLCEAYVEDAARASPELLLLSPRLAPIKAAIFPLVNKAGMPEVSEKLYRDVHRRFWRRGLIEHDVKQAIGKRYARMDEAGCPFCFTIDGQTLQDQTVTVRDRDSAQQKRIALGRVVSYLEERLGPE
ncbi:MAG TPA: glycine--tRNA ligase [Steroidobacteraceae bacterium]|nr:glycine--tRNA ligase [Steroidobacteraceae bacterium]